MKNCKVISSHHMYMYAYCAIVLKLMHNNEYMYVTPADRLHLSDVCNFIGQLVSKGVTPGNTPKGTA